MAIPILGEASFSFCIEDLGRETAARLILITPYVKSALFPARKSLRNVERKPESLTFGTGGTDPSS